MTSPSRSTSPRRPTGSTTAPTTSPASSPRPPPSRPPTSMRRTPPPALTPKQAADVMAPYTSASASLAVKLGDAVTARQIVARLDDRQLRQELEAGRAQLRTAQAAVIQAEVERRGAEIVLAREKTAEAAGVGSRADLATATQAVAKA